MDWMIHVLTSHVTSWCNGEGFQLLAGFCVKNKMNQQQTGSYIYTQDFRNVIRKTHHYKYIYCICINVSCVCVFPFVSHKLVLFQGGSGPPSSGQGSRLRTKKSCNFHCHQKRFRAKLRHKLNGWVHDLSLGVHHQ